MQKSILIALVIAVNSTRLQCSDLNQQTCSQAIRCKWGYQYPKGYKCMDLPKIVKYSYCDTLEQDICKMQYECAWSGTQCSKKDGYDKCEDITEKYWCEQQRSYGQNCDWRHNKCIPVNSCAETYGVYFCRNNKQQERCSTYDFKTKDNINYQSRMAIYNLFDNFVCAPKDCYYEGSIDNCPTFKNGKRCFISKNQECTSCVYFTNHNSCMDQKICTWDKNSCRDIQCSEMTNPDLCATQPQCAWNGSQLACSVRDSTLSICYAGALKFDKIPTGNRFPEDI